jgi:hypothetical protein
MRRTEQLQGLGMLKLRDALSGWEAGRLSQLEAAEVLGMSERTFTGHAHWYYGVPQSCLRLAGG